MKLILATVLWALSVTMTLAAEKEADYLALLHKLQFVESYQDLKKLLPNAPAPVADAGDDNSEVIVKTKLFGYPAEGEFNFHKNVLVSHGFQVKTPGYKEAHAVFLKAVGILDSQVKGARAEAGVPLPLDGEDASDGPADELAIYVNGRHRQADFQIALSLRPEWVEVRWGAQKVAAAE